MGTAPLLLGLDGRKMGKSRGNAIALGASEDETARAIRAAKTDGERRISYDPDRRPEVSNLLRLAGICMGVPAETVAEDVGDGGASALKRLTADALNERLRPIRARRAELAGERGYLRAVLARGNARAGEIAAETLRVVKELMHTRY
jgi:tryptophanyl-tRNA synthetase